MTTGYVPWSLFNAHDWSKFNAPRHATVDDDDDKIETEEAALIG